MIECVRAQGGGELCVSWLSHSTPLLPPRHNVTSHNSTHLFSCKRTGLLPLFSGLFLDLCLLGTLSSLESFLLLAGSLISSGFCVSLGLGFGLRFVSLGFGFGLGFITNPLLFRGLCRGFRLGFIAQSLLLCCLLCCYLCCLGLFFSSLLRRCCLLLGRFLQAMWVV